MTLDQMNYQIDKLYEGLKAVYKEKHMAAAADRLEYLISQISLNELDAIGYIQLRDLIDAHTEAARYLSSHIKLSNPAALTNKIKDAKKDVKRGVGKAKISLFNSADREFTLDSVINTKEHEKADNESRISLNKQELKQYGAMKTSLGNSDVNEYVENKTTKDMIVKLKAMQARINAATDPNAKSVLKEQAENIYKILESRGVAGINSLYDANQNLDLSAAAGLDESVYADKANEILGQIAKSNEYETAMKNLAIKLDLPNKKPTASTPLSSDEMAKVIDHILHKVDYLKSDIINLEQKNGVIDKNISKVKRVKQEQALLGTTDAQIDEEYANMGLLARLSKRRDYFKNMGLGRVRSFTKAIGPGSKWDAVEGISTRATKEKEENITGRYKNAFVERMQVDSDGENKDERKIIKDLQKEIAIRDFNERDLE